MWDCPDELLELRATLVRIKSGARAKGLAQPLATRFLCDPHAATMGGTFRVT